MRRSYFITESPCVVTKYLNDIQLTKRIKLLNLWDVKTLLCKIILEPIENICVIIVHGFPVPLKGAFTLWELCWFVYFSMLIILRNLSLIFASAFYLYFGIPARNICIRGWDIDFSLNRTVNPLFTPTHICSLFRYAFA